MIDMLKYTFMVQWHTLQYLRDWSGYRSKVIALWEYRNGFPTHMQIVYTVWFRQIAHLTGTGIVTYAVFTEICNQFHVRYCVNVGPKLKSGITHTSKIPSQCVQGKSTRKMLYLCSTGANWFTSAHLKEPQNVRTHPKRTPAKHTNKIARTLMCSNIFNLFTTHTHTHIHPWTCTHLQIVWFY